jgi:large subunit ribosomal protein L9
MQVLLNKDIKKLGYRGDIVAVKPGYFRNYLLPKGLAQVTTAKLIELAEARNKKRLMQKQQVLENAKEALKKLKKSAVVIKAKVTKTGKLYGSIGEKQIVEALKDQAKIELEKDYIKMKHIKELGEHEILIQLGEGLEEKVKIVVEAIEKAA